MVTCPNPAKPSSLRSCTMRPVINGMSTAECPKACVGALNQNAVHICPSPGFYIFPWLSMHRFDAACLPGVSELPNNRCYAWIVT